MGRFKYTYGGNVLTEEQCQFYEDNGYILIRNNVNHVLLDELRQRFIDICEGRVALAMKGVMKDPSLRHKGVKGEYLINKIQGFLFDDVLFKYASNKEVVDIIADIVGPNITAVHSMLINKPPNADPGASLHPLHQDLHYFPFRPPEQIVASWTAMERIDKNNGCLYVIPGTHKGDMYPHTYPEGFKNKFYYGVQGMDHLPKVHLVMEKGDTVFFHPILLHGSGPNRTKGFRKAISCHYANSNCYFVDVKGTSYERLALEFDEEVKKHEIGIKFYDYMKLRSRLITGVPGNFQNLASSL